VEISEPLLNTTVGDLLLQAVGDHVPD